MKRIPAPALLAWFQEQRRDLPWRKRRTPWRVWVSETMLQQTTVAVVAERFEKFMRLFPTPAALAAATESEATLAWAGLGYYRRVRNLRAGALALGKRPVPRAEDDLLGLPGIGPYTAAAIRAFAFDEPAAVIDANVGRVLQRFMGEEGAWNTAPVLKKARAVLRASSPPRGRDFSEGLMELGALVCTPKDPACPACPLRPDCAAHATQRVAETTTRKRRAPVRQIEAVRLRIQRAGKTLFVQRPLDADLLPGQWELPGAWCARDTVIDAALVARLLRPLGFRLAGEFKRSAVARHSVTTHQLRCTLLDTPVRGRMCRARWLRKDELPGTLTTETRKLLLAGGSS